MYVATLFFSDVELPMLWANAKSIRFATMFGHATMIVSLIFMLIITVETNYAELLVRSTGKAFNFVHHSFHSRYFASCWTEERICDFFCICCQLKEIKRKNVTFRRLPLGLPAIAMSLLVSVAGRDKSCLEWLHWEIYIYILLMQC